MEIYNIKAVYSDYVYPVEYVKIVELNLTDFEMWYLMSNEQIDIRIRLGINWTGVKRCILFSYVFLILSFLPEA